MMFALRLERQFAEFGQVVWMRCGFFRSAVPELVNDAVGQEIFARLNLDPEPLVKA